MGRVYAGHDLTLDREVAIKTLLPGANAERFIVEAKVTAKLPHPNIPPVYALGTLADGTPWLAMKLIRGQTLAKILSNGELQRPQLLQIFEQISQAVGFAHAQGVIHRDLKPLNVMVGAFGEVQVMDWGLAKELSRDRPGAESGADQASLGRESGESNDLQHTAAGTIMGTPGYMAPEQARGEVVDARADVFALGSILAAILTGKPAFVGTTALETIIKSAEADLADVLDRLDRCGADAELIAIAKHCLAAAREDRPADGRVVAELVATYRAGVEARLRQAETEAAQAVVRAEEQRKRRRQFNLAAGIIGVVLLAGLGVSLWQMTRANAAERQAVANAEQAEHNAEQARSERDAKQLALAAETLAKREAEAERERAVQAAELEKAARLDEERERKFAQAISQFVKEDFLALTSVEGQGRFGGAGLGRNTTLPQLLDRAAEKLKQRKDLDPRIEAELCWIVGVNYRGAGEAAKGVPFLERTVQLRQQVLGSDHEETLNAMNSLALCYHAAGQLDRALPLWEETLKFQKAKLGPDHPLTLTSMNNLGKAYCDAKQGAKAAPLLTEFVAGQRKRFPKGDPRFAGLLSQVALALLECEQFAVAEEMLRECLEIREKAEPEAWTTFNTLSMLGGALLGQKKSAEAEPLLLKGYEGMKARLDQIPVANVHRLALQQRIPEALDRLIALYTALDKPDEVKKYQQLRAKYPPAKAK